MPPRALSGPCRQMQPGRQPVEQTVARALLQPVEPGARCSTPPLSAPAAPKAEKLPWRRGLRRVRDRRSDPWPRRFAGFAFDATPFSIGAFFNSAKAACPACSGQPIRECDHETISPPRRPRSRAAIQQAGAPLPLRRLSSFCGVRDSSGQIRPRPCRNLHAAVLALTPLVARARPARHADAAMAAPDAD